MPRGKRYRLSSEDIQALATGRGACVATDMVTVDGMPVRFMYREPPRDQHDSGWAFFSGFESDDYANNPANLGVYDVNTIANYDPSIVPLLDSPVGCAFEKPEGSLVFVEVRDA